MVHAKVHYITTGMNKGLTPKTRELLEFKEGEMLARSRCFLEQLFFPDLVPLPASQETLIVVYVNVN